MIESLLTVARAITATASTATVAAALGRPLAGPPPDGSRATFVDPSVTGVRGLRLAPLPDDTVHTIRIELTSPIAVAALRERFGAYQVGAPSDFDAPWPVSFHQAIAGADHHLTVLLEVPGAREQLERATVTVVTLRVDRR